MFRPTTGWVAQWESASHVMRFDPGLAYLFSSYNDPVIYTMYTHRIYKTQGYAFQEF